MARKEHLFSLAPYLEKKRIGIILIQINEAHSTKWPIGKDHCPIPQKNFEERVERANQFAEDNKCPYPIYVDDWSDRFEFMFRAWPDKYYYIDVPTKEVFQKSEYGTEGDDDGVIVDDYSMMLERIISEANSK